MIHQHHKDILTGIQRLHSRTPRAVICFLAGSLPGSALLHLRQLSIFGMICRLPGNILHHHALNIFSGGISSKKSWFNQIRDHCLLYHLPHPLTLLQSPLPKLKFKQLVKSRIMGYWEQTLRSEAAPLTSLIYFKPNFMSLKSPHPLWITAGSSPAKVVMATVQARMLSGRYRTDYLCRHWSKNTLGFCLLSYSCSSTVGDLPHLLETCPALEQTRVKLRDFTRKFTLTIPHLSQLVQNFCSPGHPLF